MVYLNFSYFLDSLKCFHYNILKMLFKSEQLKLASDFIFTNKHSENIA